MKEYDEWNKVKKNLTKNRRKLGIKPRDIFWVKIGQNIGDEEYGKGSEFLRPVIVVKQLTSDLFIGVPTTTALKEDSDYFHNIFYKSKTDENINSVAMLLQLKVLSKKRLLNKMGTVNQKEFEIIINKIKGLIDPT